MMMNEAEGMFGRDRENLGQERNTETNSSAQRVHRLASCPSPAITDAAASDSTNQRPGAWCKKMSPRPESSR